VARGTPPPGLCPLEGQVEGYNRERFIEDLISECEKGIRQCHGAGPMAKRPLPGS